MGMSGLMSRRDFLGATAAGAGAVLAAGQFGGLTLFADDGQDWPGKLPDVKIYTVYLVGGRAWPKPDLNINEEVARLQKHVNDAQRKVAGVEFVGGDIIKFAPTDADKLAVKLRQYDAVLAFNLTTSIEPQLRAIVDAGQPTILFSQPFSGHDWCYICDMQKQGKKVILLATTDYGEIAQAARILRVAPRLKQTRIAYINTQPFDAEKTRQIKDKLGAEIVWVGADRLNKEYDAVDAKASQDETDRWIRQAQKVVEPTRDEILKSSRLYLAMKHIMQQENARAVTVNCLQMFTDKALPAYPCLGFCRLNDMGLVGACEGDIYSTLTMLMFNYAFDLPGFITDPAIDTSSNTIIHAHCVCPTKMDGPQGKSLPYKIRNHLEDYKGAVLQVRHRTGQTITCAKITKPDTILVSTGKITGSPDVDRGCRTKMATQVTDARAMLDNWGCGVVGNELIDRLHRVVFYGDHLRDVKNMAVLMGLNVVEGI